MRKLSIHEIITLKGAYGDFIPVESRAGLSKCWIGTCSEVVEALTSRRVEWQEASGRRLVLYRDGYPYPHFIYVGGGQFLCQFWHK